MTLISGVFCASATPINADLSPNLPAFTAHCRWLLDQGCDGVALLGTTGEANSFSSTERKTILEAALAAGIAPAQLMPGTGVANIPDTVDLTRHALAQGVTRVVMLPDHRQHRRQPPATDPLPHPADDRRPDQP